MAQGSRGFPTPVLTGVRFKGFFSAFLFLYNLRKHESTPSLYGYICKLKDNAEDCKLGPHHLNNKHLIKQMVLAAKTIFKVLFTANASPSAGIRTKYTFLKYSKTEYYGKL